MAGGMRCLDVTLPGSNLGLSGMPGMLPLVWNPHILLPDRLDFGSGEFEGALSPANQQGCERPSLCHCLVGHHSSKGAITSVSKAAVTAIVAIPIQIPTPAATPSTVSLSLSQLVGGTIGQKEITNWGCLPEGLPVPSQW